MRARNQQTPSHRSLHHTIYSLLPSPKFDSPQGVRFGNIHVIINFSFLGISFIINQFVRRSHPKISIILCREINHFQAQVRLNVRNQHRLFRQLFIEPILHPTLFLDVPIIHPQTHGERRSHVRSIQRIIGRVRQWPGNRRTLRFLQLSPFRHFDSHLFHSRVEHLSIRKFLRR